MVFANEPWYQAERSQQTTFRGLLQSADPASASGLQRSAFYRLGARAVYSGGRRLAALDALVGQQVVIVGKAVDLSLAGQGVSEIWPGFISAASP